MVDTKCHIRQESMRTNVDEAEAWATRGRRRAGEMVEGSMDE